MDGGRLLPDGLAAPLAAAGSVARIGPNAITQVAAVLADTVGDAAGGALFAHAGISGHWAEPPTAMVDDRDVERLHAVLRAELGLTAARRIGWQAGVRTGDYLLAHRIPAPAQRVLKWLPAPLAGRTLLAAIRRHAWTFTGAGRFSAMPDPRRARTWRLTIAHGPIARAAAAKPSAHNTREPHEPVCDFYAATFERLFRTLVDPRTTVRELACEALGDPACVFELVCGER